MSDPELIAIVSLFALLFLFGTAPGRFVLFCSAAVAAVGAVAGIGIIGWRALLGVIS